MNVEDRDRSRNPQSVVDETRGFWREVARETVKASATSIETTAKQLIGITGILEGLYFHAIAFGDLRGNVVTLLATLAYLAPLIFWTFSLIAAGLVFFPRLHTINLNSSEGARAFYETIVRWKYWCLVIALIWLVMGMTGLLLALTIYLRG